MIKGTTRRSSAATIVACGLLWAAGAAASPGQGAPAAGAARTVVTVNGEAITAAEVRESLELLGAGASHKQIDPLPSVNRIIETRLLEQAAAKAGYAKDPEVKKYMATFSRRVLGQLYIEALRQDFIDSQEVSEEEIKRRGLAAEPLYDVDALLLETLEDAVAVYARLKAGEPFDKLVEEFSVGLLAQQGGRLGPRDRGYFKKMFNLDIEEQNLAPGALSNPLWTQIGYVILKMNGKELGDVPRRFEEIVREVQEQKGSAQYQKQYEATLAAIPARYNKAYLENGQLLPDAIKGRPEAMPEGVYARLGDYQVTRESVQELAGPAGFSKAYTPYIVNLVQQLLYEEYFAQEARKKKPELQKSPEYVKRRTREERVQMRKRLVVDRFENKITVAPREIEEAYRRNLGTYLHGRQWEVFHILVKDEKLAEELVRRLRAGEEFAALAKQYSQDSLKAAGGFLGVAEAGQLAPQFDKAVTALKENEVSAVIADKEGFHLFKVGKILPAVAKAQSEVEGELRTAVLGRKLAQELQAFTDGLRKEARIVLDEEVLLSLKEDSSSSHGSMKTIVPKEGGFTKGQRPPGHP